MTESLRTACLVCALLACLPAGAACKLTQMEIPVRIVDQRPVATLVLNGTEVPMLVDSGAFYSLLSASTAAQLKLRLSELPWGMRIEGYTGRIEAKRTRVEKVGLRGAELSNVEFIVGGNELGAGIMGILGRNFLSIADTEYDLAHGVVRLSFPKGECKDTSFAHWAGEAPVVVVPLADPDHRGDTAIRVEVTLNGSTAVALMDTGAVRTSLSLKAARRAGIKEADMKPSGRAGGGGEGRVSSWMAPVELFELGGEKIRRSLLKIDDVSHADHRVLLGLDYFLSHRIYVSRQQQQLYITWNGAPVFASAGPEAGTYNSSYAALPRDVPAHDADALARRGSAALAAGNFARALEDLNRACELAPAVADYRYTRARLHLEQKNTALALADLDEAIRLDAALAEARLRRAWLHQVSGKADEAQADLAQLDASLAPSAHLRADMAELHAGAGRVPEALRQYELWIGTHPDDSQLASTLNSRCWMRTRLGIELQMALQDCRRAVRLDGKEANSRDSLGWVYLRLGDAAEAKHAFDAAIELKPQAISLYGRAVALRRLEDKGASERDLAAARKLSPTIDEQVVKQGLGSVEGVPRVAAPGN